MKDSGRPWELMISDPEAWHRYLERLFPDSKPEQWSMPVLYCEECVHRDGKRCTNADSPVYAQYCRPVCDGELVCKVRKVKLRLCGMAWSWPDEGVHLIRGKEYIVWDSNDDRSIPQRCNLLHVIVDPDTHERLVLVSYSGLTEQETVPLEHLHEVNAPEVLAAGGMRDP
jgi:hypothetical protein